MHVKSFAGEYFVDSVHSRVHILRWNKFNELTMKTTRNVNTKNQNVNTMDLMAYFVIASVCVSAPNIP